MKQQDDFGDETYEISVPSLPPGVVISSTQNLEFVLKHEAVITKGPFFKQRSWDLFGSKTSKVLGILRLLTPIGNGIINATGELWRVQRKAGLKFFGGASLDTLVEDVLPEAYSHLRSKLLEYAESGEQIDLQQHFLDLTTNIVGQIAYDASHFRQSFSCVLS